MGLSWCHMPCRHAHTPRLRPVRSSSSRRTAPLLEIAHRSEPDRGFVLGLSDVGAASSHVELGRAGGVEKLVDAVKTCFFDPIGAMTSNEQVADSLWTGPWARTATNAITLANSRVALADLTSDDGRRDATLRELIAEWRNGKVSRDEVAFFLSVERDYGQDVAPYVALLE